MDTHTHDGTVTVHYTNTSMLIGNQSKSHIQFNHGSGDATCDHATGHRHNRKKHAQITHYQPPLDHSANIQEERDMPCYPEGPLLLVRSPCCCCWLAIVQVTVVLRFRPI
uniref:Uncharacterized protein n=1 Tax=Anopheles funestus TaxID=62324 RepID=A0A182S4B3_ANOFN